MLYQASPVCGDDGGVEELVVNPPALPVGPVGPAVPAVPVGPVAPTCAAPTSTQKLS